MERMFTVGRLFFLGAIVVGAGCEDPASSSGPDPAPVICGEDQRVLDLDCVPCAPGTTNETGDDSSGVDTECDVILCGVDERVVAHGCEACVAGATNGAGDDASGADTSCDVILCGVDERVVAHGCEACVAGTTNEAGDDASGADTSCDVTLCGVDERVVAHGCEACVAGTTNQAGDDASGADTSCDPILCAVNEHVADNGCASCAPGTTNEPGDDASGADTSCDAVICGVHEKVVGNGCVGCSPGTGNEAGDDASGQDTSCDPCAPGTHDPGNHVCVPCEDGSISVAGASVCALCPPGTWDDGTETCPPCAPGFVSSGGALECDPCGAGTWASNNNCIACVPGSVSTEGAAACTPCDPGTWESDNDCVPCEPGAISVQGTTACFPCGAGTWASGNACVDCAPGATSNPGAASCAPCSPGTWESDNVCVDCAPGTVATSGAAACAPCAPGTWELDNQCLYCASGFISVEGASSCAPCGAGTWASDNACLDCPEGFTSSEGASSCVVSSVDSRLGVRDYGYLFWPGNHWTTWNVFHNVQHVHTGYYGLALDVSTANLDHLGVIAETLSAEEALSGDDSLVTDLLPSTVTYAVIVDGTKRVANGFFGEGGVASNPSELIDMGRFMQRVEIPEVTYLDAADVAGSVQLAAMTRHFVLTHRAVSPGAGSSMSVLVEIDGAAVAQYPETKWLDGTRAVTIEDSAGEGWSFILPNQAGATSTISRAPDGSLTFQVVFDAPSMGQEVALSVLAVPSNAATEEQLSVWLNPGETVTVEYAQMNRDGSGGETLSLATWDPERGLYLIPLSNLSAVGAPGYPNWTDLDIHNWYNRHRVVIDNTNTGPVSVPLGFDGGGNAAFYIVGGSPLFRDTNGEPTGAPVQISKNWHDPPAWYHLYSALELPPGSHEVELTFAHSKWGEAYAVAHAQLSLIGWGQNQQWDQSSLGAFGESITYDPDLTLGRSMVDDVRPFLVDAGTKWGWAGNVGGANFLLYANAETDNRPEHQLARLRTHYAYTGPNLTDVVYAGRTRDGKIEARLSTQLGRTDDLVRAYYHLHYTFLEDVTYDRLAFFQMAADRYGDNGFSHYAYGNAAGVSFDGDVLDHKTTGYATGSDRGIALTGDAPWVMLYASDKSDGNLPENLANIGFVIRDYAADIGDGLVTTPHINIVRTYNGGWSQMSFELGIPYDPDNMTVPAGSTVTATVEYVVPPSDKSAYYGESDYLTAMAAESYQSTDMMLTLAAENLLEVDASVGLLTRVHPVEIDTAPGSTAAQFILTGGLGYTPVTFNGLARPDGWRLERKIQGAWEQVNQEVEGNDYWQAYDDPAVGGFDLIFNVKNQGTQEYRLVR